MKNYYFCKNIKTMDKVFKIVKKGEDDSNIQYWVTLTYEQRLLNLEKIRQEVINRFYGSRQEFQRIYRVIERS
jgi:hypothetical protein